MQRPIARRYVFPLLAVQTLRLARRAATGLMLSAICSAGFAADLPDSLRRCATEDDDARRLACYDGEVARLGGLSSDAAPRGAAPSASRSAPATAASATTGAGKSGPIAPAVPADAEEGFGRRVDVRKKEPVEASSVVSAVAALSRGADGRLVVTLENGQVWREIAPNRSVRFGAGDTVRIERGALGSFLLVAPNKRSTKVTRVR